VATKAQKKMADRIERLKTPAGGWTRDALASLGVQWPPRKGWRKFLIENADKIERAHAEQD
jgi:hypothetical protein